MRSARRLASMLLIMALAIGVHSLIPAFPVTATAAESPILSLNAQLTDVTGRIAVSYLGADKKTYLVALLLDEPIRVSMSVDGSAAKVHELTHLALKAAPKHDKKRVKVSGTLVSSVALGLAGLDASATPCALSPAVVTPFKAARSVSIGKKIKQMGVQTSHQLSFSVKPVAAERYVRWTSNNPSVVSVDDTGLLSANAVGSAVITARARNGKKATLRLRVIVPTTSITLDKATLGLTKGGSYKLSSAIAPENATNKRVKWTSSDTRIAKVSSAGKVIAKGTGSAIITAAAKDGGSSATCLVIVEPRSGGHAARIELDGQLLALPFTRAEAQSALTAGGWKQSSQAGGFTKMSSAKHPKTAIYFDPTGLLHSLSSGDAGVLVTSRALTVGSTLKDVIFSGGTPAWHSAWAGSERFKYLLLDTTVHASPLVIDILVEDRHATELQIYAVSSPYTNPNR